MSDQLSDYIVKQFIVKVQSDSKILSIAKKIRNGGDYGDAEEYAVRTGEILSEVFHNNITADNFSVGSVDEIAQLIVPAIKMNFEANSQAVTAVQKALNEAGGIGMNPVKMTYDESAAFNIAGRMAKYESFEDAEWMLGEPIVTNSQSIVDKALHDNADFQYKSGLKPKIIRTCEPDACEWCQMLEGEYDYEDVKDRNNPVYQRHNNCHCEITYEPGDGRAQDVRSKQWIDPEERKNRIKQTEVLRIENNAVYHNNKAIILRDRYSNPDYRFKVLETHRVFADKGWQSTEHFCKRVTGRIAQGRIDSIQSIFDVLQNPVNYIDIESHNYVKWYNGIAVVIDSVNGDLVTIFTTKNKNNSWVKKL